MRRVCVFCGSNPGLNPAYTDAARSLGRSLALNGVELVFGGGHVGMMGAVADAVLAQGGHVIGVIPEALVARELAHGRVQDLRVVKSMHERKALMAELSDAFIALPGGYGTFEEFFEIVTWAQLGIHQKPSGLLNVEGYYDPLLALIDRGVAEGFIPGKHRELVRVSSSVEELLELLRAPTPPPTHKWLQRDET